MSALQPLPRDTPGMAQDERWALTDEIFGALAEGQVARAAGEAFSIQRVDDGTVLEIDLGDPETVYIVTVTSYPRVP